MGKYEWKYVNDCVDINAIHDIIDVTNLDTMVFDDKREIRGGINYNFSTKKFVSLSDISTLEEFCIVLFRNGIDVNEFMSNWLSYSASIAEVLEDDGENGKTSNLVRKREEENRIA